MTFPNFPNRSCSRGSILIEIVVAMFLTAISLSIVFKTSLTTMKIYHRLQIERNELLAVKKAQELVTAQLQSNPSNSSSPDLIFTYRPPETNTVVVAKCKSSQVIPKLLQDSVSQASCIFVLPEQDKIRSPNSAYTFEALLR